MCVIIVAFDPDGERPLVVAANRDERHARPTAHAGFWSDAPDVLAGRDLESGGTWLGITKSGRFAAITNFREMREVPPDAPSRGQIVAEFLRSHSSPQSFAADAAKRTDFAGFNAIFSDLRSLWFATNRDGEAVELRRGVYGISNGRLDSRWPKVERGRDAVASLLTEHASEDRLTSSLFTILADRTRALDGELPDTGFGLERERQLSPLFIAHPIYGTRSSTVLVVREGAVSFREVTFDEDGTPTGERLFTFVLERSLP